MMALVSGLVTWLGLGLGLALGLGLGLGLGVGLGVWSVVRVRDRVGVWGECEG